MFGASILKMYLLGTAVCVLVALYGLVDSVGGLMFAPSHHTEDEWTVKAASPALLSRTAAKKHIGLR